MRFDPGLHHRRSIRLQEYDYSRPGAYFVTVCTHNRECLLGEILDGAVQLNDAGRVAERWWPKLADKFLSVKLDAAVVMPNHFHGIILLTAVEGGTRVRPYLR